LADGYEYHYWLYLNWLKHLLERLGREHALALWEDVFSGYDEGLLVDILSMGWEEEGESKPNGTAKALDEILSELYPSPVEGVSGEQVRMLVENTPPFRQIRQHLPSLNMKRQITTYEYLHLFRDGLGLVAEALMDDYGKQGEYLIYEAMLEEWPRNAEPRMSVGAFMSKRAARFGAEPEEPDIFSAGLEVELIRSSETEVVTRVVECEWARYYREHHPQAGYMLACALDNAAYRSFNDEIRLQRTSTLMEGGQWCDFRVYGVGGN
jgi:hypothetical protein